MTKKEMQHLNETATKTELAAIDGPGIGVTYDTEKECLFVSKGWHVDESDEIVPDTQTNVTTDENGRVVHTATGKIISKNE